MVVVVISGKPDWGACHYFWEQGWGAGRPTLSTVRTHYCWNCGIDSQRFEILAELSFPY